MKGAIALRVFEARFPASKFDLSCGTLTLEPGSVTVVSGPSGSGKSTLGHAFTGLLPYLGARIKGTLTIAGNEIELTDRKAWREVRGRAVRGIPHELARVFTPTVFTLPQMLEGIEDPEAHAEQLGKLLKVLRLPDRETLQTRYPFELGRGILQRAALVSAFLPGPTLVVADEPTEHLDPAGTILLARMITTLAAHTGTAVLWITRDLRLAAAIANRVILLSEGRIERDGSPQDLLNPFGEKADPLVKAANQMALPV
jgi:peptide/nickel transport system ATP-binding protein